MRKTLILIFSLFVSTSLLASNPLNCRADSVLTIEPLPNIHPGTGPRSEVILPFSASFNSTTRIVTLTFTSDLGEIEVEVLNTYTGGYDSGIVDTQYLSAIIPITLGNGHYIITFTLPSGQQFQGEFNV